jgi:linoleoyl-CoA desaturase
MKTIFIFYLIYLIFVISMKATPFQPLRFVDQKATDARFLSTVRERVNDYFVQNNLSKKANAAMKWKTVILLAGYIFPFLYFCFNNPSLSISVLIWIIMAFAVSGIGMSIMHDANHGAYSSSHKVNDWLGLTINLAGAFRYNWKIQHNILHHTYTNITDYDDDIDDKAMLKLSPHTEAKWYHQFQWIYAFLFYAIMTIYWSVAKDFLQLTRYTKEGHNRLQGTENAFLWVRLFGLKLAYFVVLIGMPTFVFHIPIAKTIAGFLAMHIVMGLVLTIVFQLAHTIAGTEHPLPTDDLKIENNWAVHQMQTTANFATKNNWLSWYVGGLNYQIEHHLFPNICHVHYPAISKIVRESANEFQVPYIEFPTIGSALRAHIEALKRFGNKK